MVNNRTKGESYKIINWEFKKAFPLSGRNPDRKTISRNKQKFDTEGKFNINIKKQIPFTQIIVAGTVLNLNKGRSGRKPSALTPAKLQMMDDLISGNNLTGLQTII